MIWLETERLLLRRPELEDIEPWADMCADPVVMEYFPRLLTPTEARKQLEGFQRRWVSAGICFAAAVLRSSGAFIGLIGLGKPVWDAPFTLEVGWRLAPAYWGHGYATEGGAASLARGFADFDVDSISAITTPENRRSRAVMERLGMSHDPADDFDHLLLEPDDPLRRHVHYKISRADCTAS